MPVAAGKLDQRIELQRRATSRDAAGGAVETWSTYGRAWAAKAAASGRSATVGQQRVAEADTVFTIRYRTDLALMDRIIFRGAAYAITWFDTVGTNEAITILPKRVEPHPMVA